jgi:DNA-binding response OmpR family regulator
MVMAPRRKVLFVDDDVQDLEYYARVIESQGHEVLTCANYDLGAKLAGSETFDLIIVSQGGQAFEGRAVVEHAMGLDRRIPVLVVTRAVEMNCYLEAMQLGAVDYIEKPVSPQEMMRFVRCHASPGVRC